LLEGIAADPGEHVWQIPIMTEVEAGIHPVHRYTVSLKPRSGRCLRRSRCRTVFIRSRTGT
jgi:hypothetical protein